MLIIQWSVALNNSHLGTVTALLGRLSDGQGVGGGFAEKYTCTVYTHIKAYIITIIRTYNCECMNASGRNAAAEIGSGDNLNVIFQKNKCNTPAIHFLQLRELDKTKLTHYSTTVLSYLIVLKNLRLMGSLYM